MKKVIHIIFILVFGSIFFYSLFSGSFLTGGSEEIQNYKTMFKKDAVFSDVKNIVTKDDKIYCQNGEHQILVFSIDGKYNGFFQIPYKHRKDSYDLYVYKDLLCVKHNDNDAVHGDIYMFDGEKYCGMVDMKFEGDDGRELIYTVKDSDDKVIYDGELLDEETSILAYRDGKIFYDEDDTVISEQAYQKHIELSGGKQFKLKGLLRKELVLVDKNGDEKIIASEKWSDFIKIPIVCIGGSFLVILINLYMLFGKKIISKCHRS